MESNSIPIEKLAVKLYAFLKQSGLKVGFTQRDALSYTYQLADLTEDAEGIAISFILDLPFLANFSLDDTDESIEKFCYGVTLNLGNQLFKLKCDNLLQFDNKSKIILA